MIEGMLWFDNSPKTTLSEKLRQACDYYKRKYRAVPSVVELHPKMLTEGEAVEVEGVDIRESFRILPWHYLIYGPEGIGGDTEKQDRI